MFLLLDLNSRAPFSGCVLCAEHFLWVTMTGGTDVVRVLIKSVNILGLVTPLIAVVLVRRWKDEARSVMAR